MKFIYEKEENLLTLYDVNYGDVFLLERDLDRTVFMRIYSNVALGANAINLSNGELVYLKNEERIIPVDATLTVTHP